MKIKIIKINKKTILISSFNSSINSLPSKLYITPKMITIVEKSTKRQLIKIFLNILFVIFFTYLISKTSYGFNQVATFTEFCAERSDMNINRAVFTVKVITPYAVK